MSFTMNKYRKEGVFFVGLQKFEVCILLIVSVKPFIFFLVFFSTCTDMLKKISHSDWVSLPSSPALFLFLSPYLYYLLTVEKVVIHNRNAYRNLKCSITQIKNQVAILESK